MACRGKRGGQRVREKAERALELQERQDADDAALEDYLENMLREAGEEEGEAAEDQEEAAGKRFAAAFVRGADMEVGDQLDGAYLDPGVASNSEDNDSSSSESSSEGASGSSGDEGGAQRLAGPGEEQHLTAFPYFTRAVDDQKRSGKHGKAPKQKSLAKGALGGALLPGEKKRLKKQQKEARRAARDARRGFDVRGVVQDITHFMSSHGDMLALPTGGKHALGVTINLVRMAGLRASIQGSGKKQVVVGQWPAGTARHPLQPEAAAKLREAADAEVAAQRVGAAAGGGVGPEGMAHVTPLGAARVRQREQQRQHARLASHNRQPQAVRSGTGGSGSASSRPIVFVSAGTILDDDGPVVVTAPLAQLSAATAAPTSVPTAALGVSSVGQGSPQSQETVVWQQGDQHEADARAVDACTQQMERLWCTMERRFVAADQQQAGGGLAAAHWRGVTGGHVDSDGQGKQDDEAGVSEGASDGEQQTAADEELARGEADEEEAEERCGLGFVNRGGFMYATPTFTLGLGSTAGCVGVDEGGGVDGSVGDARGRGIGSSAHSNDGKDDSSTPGIGFNSSSRGSRALPPPAALRARMGDVQHEPSPPLLADRERDAASAIRQMEAQAQEVGVNQTKQAVTKAAKKAGKMRRRAQLAGGSGQAPENAAHATTVAGQKEALPPHQALHFTFAQFEQHTTGIGSRLLRQMGWAEGQGLGANRQGRAQPVLPTQRPKGLGLGADA